MVWHSCLDAMLSPVMEETLGVTVFITLIVRSVSPTVNKSLLQQTRARWKLVGKVLPFSVLLNKLVTHCLYKVRSQVSLPLCIEVPAQGDWFRPDHRGVRQSQVCHGGACEVDHDHPHPAGPSLRTVIVVTELFGVD